MTEPQKINMMEVPFSAAEIEGTLQGRLRRVASIIPDQVAVNVITDRLTYAELDHLTNHIAHAICQRISPDVTAPVAVLSDQGQFFMAGLFGALKSSRAAVAFPPNSSPEQLRFLWDDSLHPLVLTTRTCLARIQEVVKSDAHLLLIDDFPRTRAEQPVPAVEPRSEDIAMIAYTSGSTGSPKGVMQSHRLLLHSAHQNHHSYSISTADRNAVLASFGYGAAKTQCLAALLSGATLYLPPVRQVQVNALIDLFEREKVSIIAMPPIGLFRHLLEALEGKRRLPLVRLVLLGGDDLSKQEVERFWNCFPNGATLGFRLAGTEYMLIREIHIQPNMEISSDKVPVGFPVPDKEILLLDDKDNQVSTGEIGEIVVRSPYLASGYWGLPELTDERFRPDPGGSAAKVYHTGDLARLTPDGQLELMGRKDNMVKVHGFSVHLEMVEMALQKLPFVSESVALAFPLPDGDKRLVAYLVPSGEEKPSVSEIREELIKHLPEYMLPSSYVWMKDFPRTFAGKIDRKALPPPPRTRPDLRDALVLPRTDLETVLAQVWEDLLQLDEVGVNDNFFDLGGDSLLSIQMIMESEKILGKKVPLSYFKEPTIACLAGSAQRQEKEVSVPGETTSLRDGDEQRQRHPERASRYRRALRKLMQGTLPLHSLLEVASQSLLGTLLFRLNKVFSAEILAQPYPQGCGQLVEMAANPRLARGVYRSKAVLFNRFVQDMDRDDIDLKTAFTASLVGNLYFQIVQGAITENPTLSYIERLRTSPRQFWSSLATLIDHAPLAELQRFFSVAGLNHLKEAHLTGRGVIIITYHSSANRFAMAALPRNLDVDSIPTISQRGARRRSDHWRENRADIPQSSQAALYAGAALEGQRLLEQGRIVQFVSDVDASREGRKVIVAGRIYALRPGFAELAVNTGAWVIPQFTTIRPSAHIHTTFLPPFTMGNGSREEKINSLLSQYADFITYAWRMAPESLLWGKMARHFRQPKA